MNEFRKSRFANLDIEFIDGTILSAKDLNDLVFKIKEGVERNFHDIGTIIFNNPDAEIIYGEGNLDDDDGLNGDYAGVFNEFGQLTIFKKVDGMWERLRDVSLAMLADEYIQFTEKLTQDFENLELSLEVISGGSFVDNE